jgi:hypothetical protein
MGTPLHSSKGLRIYPGVEFEDMNALMMAYACETVDIRHAEAFIAEREYNRSLIRAKSVKLFMSQRRNTFEHEALKELSDAAHPRREQRDMTRQSQNEHRLLFIVLDLACILQKADLLDTR